MAGQSWTITIRPGPEGASFVPDVYVPPGETPSPHLQAQLGDQVSWNNQTQQEHEIWVGNFRLTEQIAPGGSSTPGYIVFLAGGVKTGTIDYHCGIHTSEKGIIDVVA